MRSVFTSLFLYLFCLSANSQRYDTSSLAIYGFQNQLAVAEKISCYIDEANTKDISTIQPEKFSIPYQSFFQRINSAPWHKAFWLKFGLENKSDSILKLFIYCGDLNYVDIWSISGYTTQLVRGGNLRREDPFFFTQASTSIIALQLKPKQQSEIFIRIRQQTQEYGFDGIEIYDQQNLDDSLFKDYKEGRAFIIFQFLFQGFLICQILYVLFQWLITRRSEYLYYFFYLLVIAIYFLSKYEQLYGITILFTRYPLLKIYLGKTLLILPYFFYFKFVSSFLEIPGKYPGLYRLIRYVEYFLFAYVLSDFIFIIITFNQKLQSTLYTVIILIVFIITASFIVYMFRQKQKLIYYVLTGSLFAAVGSTTGLILTYLSYNSIVDFSFHNFLIFSQIGVLLEILCFTAGLSYKSKKNEEDKISGQQKLIEQLKANEQLQSNMQNIRNKIAQDLHDDIGSTLSSISILSDLALKEKDASQTTEAIHEIKDNSVTLMEKMDDIVWSINPKNDSLENLLMRIRRFATALFEAKDIDYTISISEHIHEIKLPVDYRQHIYLILKEAINNLAKYSKATKANIDIEFAGYILRMSVMDNGIGFSSEENSTGNGILNMKTRAALMNASLNIKSGPGKGTVISLAVKIE
ncbi:MAG: hypothetical protein JST96_07560 [Bacteroidetes bacterium]|nr:hypothetical protein [Bacteroidota bacterium]